MKAERLTDLYVVPIDKKFKLRTSCRHTSSQGEPYKWLSMV